MILLTHIFVALAGIVFSTFSLFAPSAAKLKVIYGLLAGTLVSGTVLVISTHSSILQGCLSGLFYTGFVGSMSGVVHYRLARQRLER